MAGNDVQIQIIGKDMASTAFSQVNSAAKTTTDNLNRMGSSVTSLNTAFGSSVSSIVSKIGMLTAGIISAQTAMSGLTTGIKFDSMMQQSELAFGTILKDTTKAKQLLGELWQMAADTPFEMNDLTLASKKMLAYGFSAQEIIPMLRTVGDTTAALGLSGQEGLGRITIALGQMKARTKVSADEMRQLTEVGIPAWDILAKSMGKTTQEVMKLSEQGVIPANEAIKALLAGMNDNFSGMTQKSAQTYQGLMATLKDETSATLGAVVKPAFSELSQTTLPAVIGKVQEFRQQLEWNGWTGAFKTLLPAEVVDTTVNGLTSIKNTAKDTKDAINDLKQTTEDFTPVIAGVAAAIGVGFAPGLLTTFTNGARSAIGAVEDLSRSLLMISAGGVLSGIYTLGAAWDWLKSRAGVTATGVGLITAATAYMFRNVPLYGRDTADSLNKNFNRIQTDAQNTEKSINNLTMSALRQRDLLNLAADVKLEEDEWGTGIAGGRALAKHKPTIDNSNPDWSKMMTVPPDLVNIIKYASQKTGVSEKLIQAVMMAESSFNKNATSPAGAMGLMQLMPDTAASLGVDNPYDPMQNTVGGARYLSQLARQFNGDITKVIAGYNAGPDAVKQYGGIPPYKETQEYVQKVTGYLNNGTSGGANTETFNLYEMEQKLKQYTDKLTSLSDNLDQKIAQSTKIKFESATAALNKEVDKMRQDIRDISDYGLDTSAVTSQLEKYEALANAKILEDRNKSLLALRDETSKVNSTMVGDKRVAAEQEFQAAKNAIDREVKEKFENVAKNKDDEEAKAAVAQWRAASEAKAEKEKNNTIRDYNLSLFDLEITHNNMLVELKGKTLGEIDNYNQIELNNKILYLNKELTKATLTKDEIIKLEKEKSNAMRQQYEINGRNISTAYEEAMRRINSTQTDYAGIMVDSFGSVTSSIKGHLKSIFTFNESIAEGIKGTVKDLSSAIIGMMVDMYFQAVLLNPIRQWWGGVLSGMTGVSASSVGVTGSTNIGTFKGGTERYAADGLAAGWSVVGEEGPELVNFTNPIRVYTAKETRDALRGGGNQSNNVTMVFPSVTEPKQVQQFRNSRAQMAKQAKGFVTRGGR